MSNALPSSVSSINLLPEAIKRDIYTRLIPRQLLELLKIPDSFVDERGRPLIFLNCPAGSSVAETRLYHQFGFPDPVLYGQMTDTYNGQIHILLYVINDPTAPRFDVDRMPDGSPTEFGVLRRNLVAEEAAMQAGLAPGQIRRGLRKLGSAIQTFEEFSTALGHDRFFAEPLYYHNAIILEQAGFAYMKGRRLMESINAGFAPGGELLTKLDGSTPFRMPEAARSVRLRSWAIHDGILGQPFTNVTMYKVVDKDAKVRTFERLDW